MSFGHLNFSIFCAVLICGCAQTKATNDDYYGNKFKDHDFCMSLTKDIKLVRSGILNPTDVERLFQLSLEENPVAIDAISVLGAFAQNNTSIKSRLIESVPTLLSSNSSYRVYNAVNLIKWFKLRGFEGQLQNKLKALSSKDQLADADTVAKDAIFSFLEEQK